MTYENRDTMSRSVVELPPEEQEKLRRVRESNDLVALRQRVLALRVAKWPLRAIGDPLGAPRSTVGMWEKGADSEGELPSVPECDRAQRERGERIVNLRMDVPPEERNRLFTLAEEARLVRGRTPKDAPASVAAAELDELIFEYIERNVPVKRIANYMGVTPRAVTARYQRYNKRKGSDD
jgi:hypothetical protein